MGKDDDKRPFIELSKKERKEKARKLLFGDFKDEYMGNIWGWRFSIISLIGLLLVGGLAFYGIYTGKIDPSQFNKDNESSLFKNSNPYLNKDEQKDTIIQ
ncbi:MAG: hypothetical protein MK207_13415 [Saprospiraceae bacterium]|nr:hypothetical protein [Saprospiraceae bacterium]